MIIFARRARGGLKARNSCAEFLEKPVKFRYDFDYGCVAPLD